MNVVSLVGRLTADPDSRTVAVDGTERTTTTLGLAITPAGGRDAEPVYIDVTVWGPSAQACATYLRKGRRVAVTGRLDLARWTAEDGTPRRVHRVVANHVDFLDASQGSKPVPTAAA
ncbi:MAG: single-stranded DNA-binding protein [Acidimicrobiia bacterium]